MSEEIIDFVTLDSLKELLGDAFGELISTYLEDSAKRVEKLKVAIPEKEFNTVTHEAHGLKGSSRNLGITKLGNVCEKLEHDAKDNIADNFEQYFTAVEQEFAAVSEVLREYL